MDTTTQPSKAKLWISYILSAAVALFMLMGAVMNFMHTKQAAEGTKTFGYPESAMLTIGILALLSTVLYIIPRTAVLGAIVMTGYFGGAIATHIRISDPGWPMALIFGIIIWLALYLREPRLGALVPLRK
jgi:hypothetical protein